MNKQDTKDHDTLIKNGWFFVPKDEDWNSTKQDIITWGKII